MKIAPRSSELKDSKSWLHDSEALRARIATDGYVFMRGLLDPSMIRAVGARGLGYLQEAGWTERGADPVGARPVPVVRAVKMRDAVADRGYRRILADPGFNSVPFVSPLKDLMTQILGPAAFCYPLKFPRVVYPTTLVPRHPGNIVHRDYRSVQDMFTCWVPYGAVPQELGGLAILAGSQRGPTQRFRPLNRLEPGWLSTDYEPGDVLVFHCLTTHASLPNRGHRMRLSGEYRWQVANQPAPRRLVVGPQGNEIGWRLFSHTPWWHSVAEGLTLFDDGGADAPALLPAPPSRFVASAH